MVSIHLTVMRSAVHRPCCLVQVLRLWARILLSVPRSRLVLKNKPFACDTARAHVLNLLAAEVGAPA